MENLSADEFFEYHCTDENAKKFYDEKISHYETIIDELTIDNEALTKEVDNLNSKIYELRNMRYLK